MNTRTPPTGTALPNPLLRGVLAHPHAIALRIHGGPSWTWRTLYEAALPRARALHAAGVGPGDVVTVSTRCHTTFVRDAWAVWLAGACLRPIAGPTREIWAAPTRDVITHGDGSPWRGSRTWSTDAPLVDVCTSGSTGAPRRHQITVGQAFFATMGSALRLGHLPGDVWLCPLPLHHVGGLAVLTRAAWLGIAVSLPTRFDAPQVAEALRHGACSLVSLVPAMLADTLDRLERAPVHSDVRAVLVGGGPCPEALVRRAEQAGLPLALTWGMTESFGQLATWRPGDFAAWPSAGAPLHFAEVSAHEGRLHIAGLQAPTAPGERLTTQDRGSVRQGRVHVDGRADDVIISGGEKLDLRALREHLLDHDGVADVWLDARDDPRWGQRPAALVVPADASSREARRALVDQTLPAWVATRFAPWATPDPLRAVEALPRTALGKVDAPQARSLLYAPRSSTQPSPHASWRNP